mgnify:CR=1 FL=1|jgi:hypothetical protein
MKMFVMLLLVVISNIAIADSGSLNLSLPNSNGSYASDRVRAGDVECQNAIGSATNLEFGVVGIINQNGPFGNSSNSAVGDYDPEGMVKDVGVYAKITIPLTGPRERINCNDLFKLEMEKKRMEIQRLKAEVANLRALQFEGDD